MRTHALQKTVITTAAVLALSLALLAGCSTGEGPTTVIRTAPNGVTIIVEENRGVQVVSVQAWIRDGALYEPHDEVGEAMMLHSAVIDGRRGEELYELASEFSSIGGKVSGYASYDFVSFMATAPSRHFDLTARLMQMGVTDVDLDDEDVERARDAVASHISKYESSEREAVYMAGLATLMPDHPYGVSAYGTMRRIEEITAEELMQRYERTYVGSNLVVTVAGDVDAVEAANLMESLFSCVPAGERARPAATQGPWPKDHPRIERRGRGDAAYLIVNYPAPPGSSDDVAAMDLLLMALARSRVSRLNTALMRENEYVSDVGAGWGTHIQPYPFQAWMHLPPGNVDAALATTVQTFAELAEEEVSPEELERLKTLLLTEIAIANEPAGERAAYRGYWTIVGGMDFIDDYFAGIEAATPSDLRRVAEQYFTPENHLAAVLTP